MQYPSPRRALAGRLTALLVLLCLLALAGQADLDRPAEAQSAAPAPIDASGLRVVSYHDLGQAPGRTSDVWLLGDTAFTGYRCANEETVGSSVIDVTDPTAPQVLFQTPVDPYWFANDVKALRMDTAAFTGDVLIEPLDGPCSTPDEELLPPATTRFWDVSDPANPQLLSELITGDGVHNAYAFNRGENSYVILAAPGADNANNDTDTRQYEDQDLDADLVVIDMTDPRNPEIIARWNAHATYPEAATVGSTFQHDTWVNEDGTLIYGAYWDLGMVLLDLTDPTNPTPLGKVGYADRAAGNTHAIVPLAGEDEVVITDEVFSNTDARFEVLTPDPLAGEKDAAAGAHLDPLMAMPGLSLEGEMVWVGRGCDADPQYGLDQPDPYLNDATGKIAVIVRGDCSFAGKIRQAQENGAIGAMIVNNGGGSPPPMGGGPRSDTTIPGWGINHADGNAITTTLEAGTAVTGRIQIVPDAFGFTRFADVSDPSNPQMLASEFTIPQTRQVPAPAGTWSVHNPWVDGDKVYLSHYSAGLRVLDVADPTAPTEVQYAVLGVPQPDDTVRRNSIWGVITDEEGYIYLSDINNGFWILAEEDPNQPTNTPEPPTPEVPTETPVPPPTATEDLGNVCPQIVGIVPQAAIQAATSNPASIAGYNQLHDPSKPAGPNNRLRTWLSIRSLASPYHPLFNTLIYKAGCP